MARIRDDGRVYDEFSGRYREAVMIILFWSLALLLFLDFFVILLGFLIDRVFLGLLQVLAALLPVHPYKVLTPRQPQLKLPKDFSHYQQSQPQQSLPQSDAIRPQYRQKIPK